VHGASIGGGGGGGGVMAPPPDADEPHTPARHHHHRAAEDQEEEEEEEEGDQEEEEEEDQEEEEEEEPNGHARRGWAPAPRAGTLRFLRELFGFLRASGSSAPGASGCGETVDRAALIRALAARGNEVLAEALGLWGAGGSVVRHSCACIGSPCLRKCVHGASIGSRALGCRRQRGAADGDGGESGDEAGGG
jgi:hypothetical protein